MGRELSGLTAGLGIIKYISVYYISMNDANKYWGSISLH
jgi:hypothetical protein